MTKSLFILLTITTISIVNANPNYVINIKPTYDKKHNLITPDKILLAKAIKSYQDGYNQSAMTKFKQAAAFGNTQAQKYIGLMYIKSLGVEQSWAKGYAWIKLAALDKTKEHLQLSESIYAQLKNEERALAEKEFATILAKYDQSSSLERRVRWAKKQAGKSLGSRTGSQTANVKSLGANGVKLGTDRTSKIGDMQAFVQEYNFGIVQTGEIKVKDD